MRYKRILLKVSGEALKQSGTRHFVDEESMSALGIQLVDVLSRFPGLQIYVMFGGGNFERGRALLERTKRIKKRTAHYAGMLYTLINGMFMRDVLRSLLPGRDIRLMSAISVRHVAEDFYPEPADHHSTKGRIVLLGAGSGKTGMTTDLAASIMAAELECELLVKGTKVDGLYTGDPTMATEEKPVSFISSITYAEYKAQGFDRIFDSDAVGKVEKDEIPVRIFNIFKPGLLTKIVEGASDVGSLIWHTSALPETKPIRAS